MTNKPKRRCKNNRGSHLQRDTGPLPCGIRSRESTHSSGTPSGCQGRCAILSRFFGWVGGGFPQLSKANTLTLLSCGSYFFFSKGAICYASFGPDVQISVSVHPARNTTIIYLSFQHMQQRAAAVRCSGWQRANALLQSHQHPSKPGHKGKAPHSSPLRHAIYRLLYLKP